MSCVLNSSYYDKVKKLKIEQGQKECLFIRVRCDRGFAPVVFKRGESLHVIVQKEIAVGPRFL